MHLQQYSIRPLLKIATEFDFQPFRDRPQRSRHVRTSISEAPVNSRLPCPFQFSRSFLPRPYDATLTVAISPLGTVI
jgi:hypothetical protein